MCPPGAVIEAFTALVGDGTLYVLRVEMPGPPATQPFQRPPRGPCALWVAHVGTGNVAGLDATAGPLPLGKGRLVTIPELDEVVREFAAGRVMALPLSGEGIPTTDKTYLSLMEIGGAFVQGTPPKSVS